MDTNEHEWGMRAAVGEWQAGAVSHSGECAYGQE